MSLTALMSIGALVANAASEAVEDPEWKKKLAMLGKGLAAGLTIGGKAAEFKSPNIAQTPTPTDPSPTPDSISDFTKSLTIKTPGGGAVDQVLNRNITQGLFGNTGNNIFDPFDIG